MNNNNNYEQEFMQNVKQTTHNPTNIAPKAPANPAKVPLIIATVLAFILLIESIVLVIFTVNYFSPVSYEEDLTIVDDSPEAISANSGFTYGDDYGIVAFSLVCTNEDGANFTFTKSKTYQRTDSSSNLIDSGTYSIVNSSAVVLNSSDNATEDKIVYYDGYDIIEGLNFYTCKET